MQQATVNLFADMGAQATTLMSGLAAASPSTDTTRAQLDDHEPVAGRGDRRRHAGDDLRHRDRRRRRGGGRRGLDRRRHDAGIRPPGRRPGPTAGSRTARRARRSRSRAVDDSGNLESSPPSVSVDVGCPCTMAGPNVTPSIVDQRRPQRGRGRRPVQGRPRRDDHRRPLLQGDGEHRHAHRQPVDDERDAARHAGRSAARRASGWQQLTFTTPVDITAGTTYVASYYAPRGHYSASPGYFYWPSPIGGEHARQPAAARHQRERRRRQRRLLATRAATTFPTSTFNGENYAVDVVFMPKLPPGPVGTLDGDGRPRLARPSASSRRRPAARPRATSSRRSSARRRSRRRPSPAARRRPPSRSAASIPATSYTFKVQAANGSGSGPLSAASNAVTPTAPTAPGAPTGRHSPARQPARRPCAGPRRTTAARTITRYTITPYLDGVAQTTTAVTGSPAPTTARRDRA